jgi:hypothetical protein
MIPAQASKSAAMIDAVLSALWHAKNDRSLEAVYLFSLLGLTLTVVFSRLG